MKIPSRRDVDAAVEDWVNHTLPNEPDGLTSLRSRYVEHHLDRSLRVMELIPQPHERGRLLELGSGLYFMTFLLQRISNYDLDLVQYWSRADGEYESVLQDRRDGKRIIFPFLHYNAEATVFPYPNETYNVVLCCEMIEHLVCDPVHVLAEIHRVLKPGGRLVLSTPNVLRWSNLLQILRGENIYDKYCRESMSARHAREYTTDELLRLVETVGFRVSFIETRDVTKPTDGPVALAIARLFTGIISTVKKLRGAVVHGTPSSRGEQIFLVAEKREGEPTRVYPDHLFERPDISKSVIDSLFQPRSRVGADSAEENR